jgi:hypothetical protein
VEHLSPQDLNLETVKPIVVKKVNLGTGDSGSSLQLTVRLVPEDRRTIRKWLADTGRRLWGDPLARSLMIVGIVALPVLLLQRALFFRTLESDYTIGPFSVFAQYPMWIAPRDEESFAITLSNGGNTDLTQVKVHLLVPDALCLCTDAEGSTVIEFEELASGERKTRTASLRLERPVWGTPMPIEAWLISAERGVESAAPLLNIRVIFIPSYKTWVQRVLWALVGLLGAVAEGCLKWLMSVLGLKE